MPRRRERWRKRRGTAVFVVSIANRGTTADQFIVNGLGSDAAYRVRYFMGGIEVTTSVVNGTLQTGVLQPGQVQRLKIKVRVLRNAPVGSQLQRLLTLTSVGNSNA
jgi:uncharacterized membrane protein